MIRAFICEMLNRKGYKAIGVKDGRGAMNIIRDHTAIDLILTDYNLADTTGDEFLKNVRTSGTQEIIPVIFLTAESDPDKILQAKQAALVGWVQKPFRIETLFEHVKQAIDGVVAV